MSKSNEYLVVLRNQQGSITWTVYQTPEAFQKSKKKLIRLGYAVVAEGVSEEEAIRLCRATPAAAVMREAILGCTDPATGEIISELVPHEIDKAQFALNRDSR